MMRVFIAEKPELASAIVEALGGGSRRDGYYQCGKDAVTWCFGHMLRLLDPEEYDPKYATWSLADLPIAMVPWKKTPITRKGSHQQLKVIIDLLKQSESAVHAGDPDEEGQFLVDEVLQYVKYRKPVQRLLINDNNTKLVRKALASMQSNADFRHLSAAAEARAVGDQLYGYNMSRAYTLVARKAGYQGTLTVGRVQTPILGMVVRRTRAFRDHKKSFYYHVLGQFSLSGVNVLAKYMPDERDPQDDKRRLIDEARAKEIAKRVKGARCMVDHAETRSIEKPPPLPYNLIKLQADAARKYALKPGETKDITQSLRERHKLITYNRSDCQYLSDEHHADARDVLNAIAETCSALDGPAHKANPDIKSRAFDSSKVSAHHAIIPTATSGDFSALSDGERKVYALIARAYVAQFFPPHRYDQTILHILAAGGLFEARSRITTRPGWTVLYGADDESDDDWDVDQPIDLRGIRKGDTGVNTDTKVEQKETRPQPLYTMASLLLDLTSVAKYIKDDKLRKLMIDKDKDKEGENGGIGTSATRDTIIQNLMDRGFITERGKSIIPTDMGERFYDVLPQQAKFPDMTAIWHEQQNDIRDGKMDVSAFVDGLSRYVSAEIDRVVADGLDVGIELHACPACRNALRRIKRHDGGFFWGCSNREAGCSYTCDDAEGAPAIDSKPGARPASQQESSGRQQKTAGRQQKRSAAQPQKAAGRQQSGMACPMCGGGMIERLGPRGKFLGCASFPRCRGTANFGHHEGEQA